MKRLLAVVGMILLVVLCWGAWRYQTTRVLDQVEVHTARPVCAGTTLEGDHTIRAQRGMSCTVTVTIANTSTRTVHVRRVELPYFGSEGGWVIQAGSSTASQLENDGVDASLPIGADLNSGDLLQFGIELAYRESGCSGGRNSGTDWVAPWPEVTVAFLGRAIERSGDGELRFSQISPARGCQVN